MHKRANLRKRVETSTKRAIKGLKMVISIHYDISGLPKSLKDEIKEEFLKDLEKGIIVNEIEINL